MVSGRTAIAQRLLTLARLQVEALASNDQKRFGALMAERVRQRASLGPLVAEDAAWLQELASIDDGMIRDLAARQAEVARKLNQLSLSRQRTVRYLTMEQTLQRTGLATPLNESDPGKPA